MIGHQGKQRRLFLGTGARFTGQPDAHIVREEDRLLRYQEVTQEGDSCHQLGAEQPHVGLFICTHYLYPAIQKGLSY
jgi:hypothetical protein